MNIDLAPENGYVPNLLFDHKGSLTFVLGWGNYLPGLHTLLVGMAVGESVHGTSIDAGYGQHRDDLVITLPKHKVKAVRDLDSLRKGDTVTLTGGVQVQVLDITNESITVDANAPLAGASYSCNLTVEAIESMPATKTIDHKKKQVHNDNHSTTTSSSPSSSSRFEMATFALSCFWSAELAFMRQPGVVGTRVGFTQGNKAFPTYQEVKSGTTRHREAVLVVYDTTIVSYERLVQLALQRLAATSLQENSTFVMNMFAEAEDDVKEDQYAHGFYYHNEQQKAVATAAARENANRFDIEVKPATTFYEADDYHQQYLLKGGQSARKGAKETIRCFG